MTGSGRDASVDNVAQAESWRPHRVGLRTRLVVAFVALAVVSVVVLAVAILLTARVELDAAEHARQRLSVEQVVGVVSEAQDGDQLDAAVLMSAYALAAAEGAALELRDAAGDVLDLGEVLVEIDGGVGSMAPMSGGAEGMRPPGGAMDDRPLGGGPQDHARMMDRVRGQAVDADGPTLDADVAGDGDPIASVAVTFPAARAAPAQQLAAGIARNVWLAAAVVAVLAVAVALVVSRQLLEPVAALSRTVERIARGEPRVRSGVLGAPGELGALAGSVDRMADVLDRQEQLRRELVANVAHELRTPLAVALAETEAMLDGVRPTTADQVTSIRDELVMLARLVGDLEALAAAQAAVLHLELEQVDLADLVEERIVRARDRLDLGRRTLALDAGTGCEVVGDQLRLAQVIDNLLRNAIAYTTDTGRIEVTVRPLDGQVELTVLDDGPGIGVDERERVFDRFFRGSAAADSAGSGVGLAIAAELVHAHNGQIAAVDPPTGRGACLHVALPAARRRPPTGS